MGDPPWRMCLGFVTAYPVDPLLTRKGVKGAMSPTRPGERLSCRAGRT
ncbi:MAG TPA: hypothetical protein VFM09_12645 [Marmoricola sp.]|nr:hypothetical protein [Marmoricola sp.]